MIPSIQQVVRRFEAHIRKMETAATDIKEYV